MNGRTEADDMEREYQRQSLRDTFAAAALPLCTRNFRTAEQIAESAYKLADAMLRERSRTGQKVAENDSFCAVVHERDNTSAQTHKDRGSVTPESYEKSDEKRVLYDTKRATTQPRNGALSGCETVPDPDSRVWETQRTPPPHATPTQGSVQGEGSVPCSRTENEPVAWAVYCDGTYDASFCGSFDAKNEAEEWCNEMRFEDGLNWEVVPLYRHPQPTLTPEEQEALEAAVIVIDARNRLGGPVMFRGSERAAVLRGLLERLA